MMAQQARDTSMITDCRQAHDHQAPCLCHVTTRPSSPNCRALLVTRAALRDLQVHGPSLAERQVVPTATMTAPGKRPARGDICSF
jgi:hypothetical protein